ncbi:hypothetical protein WANA31_0490 [Wolbachia endosymbiont of Drosophila ananassae]|nr:hypothetical protein WANA34_0569 [Wolbachia endosymbiont of Drosophila ananassae]RLT62292.1 hypothetical protein WANA13_1012 [Wolbachia endosymbiont of Drosophila ananassae]RLT62461.1 hypothetical protein WANA31_0490 [Wolbachia endosymbiont of Drosophila ananassae]
MPSTGMTSSLMEIALKSQCSYSYGMNRGMTVISKHELL